MLIMGFEKYFSTKGLFTGTQTPVQVSGVVVRRAGLIFTTSV